MNNAGLLLKLFAAVAVVAVLSLATATWFFFMRPLTLDAAVSRLALGYAGLTRRQLGTASGRTTVFEGGHGSPLILVHDAGDQAGGWARVVTPLIEDHRVVIPDLSGHGGSDPASGPITPERIADDFSSIVADCCPEGGLTLVGQGFGAWVVHHYAAGNPERILRLVLVNGGSGVPVDTPLNLFPKNREQALEMMQGLMGTSATELPGYVLDDIVRHRTSGPASRIDFSRLPPALDGLPDGPTVPVVLIWGAHDALYPLEYAARVRTRLGAGTITALEDCGHMPQRECPVEFVDALRAAIGSAE